MEKSKKPFINRDESWIMFNNRVLEEAKDKNIPLLERAMVLSFVESNKDEFFMVRLGSRYEDLSKEKTKNKKEIKNFIYSLSKKLCKMDKEVTKTYYDILNDLQKNEGIKFYTEMPNDKYIKDFAAEIFKTKIQSLLTPISIMPTRPFPLVKGKSLHMAIMLEDSINTWITMKMPESMPRFIKIPSEDGEERYILIDLIIKENLPLLLGDKKIKYATTYRILRNAEAAFTDIETGDFLSSIRKVLQARKRGVPVRFEVPHTTPQELVALMANAFKVSTKEIFRLEHPLELVSLLRCVYKIENHDNLRYESYKPYLPKELDGTNLFEEISRSDKLLFHPYDSFDPVVNLVREAAFDPNVHAIKQTLYRVSGNSPIISALIEAAKAGKQVTVFIELKARFDEQNNIVWGEMMEHAGCQVIYGLPGLKTHSKITLIARHESSRTKYYLHLGTGNYHDGTAKSYTDISLLTANDKLGKDALQFFQILTGYGKISGMNSLITAPDTLRKKLTTLINHETDLALNGFPASITAKMNALVDPDIVDALYKASQAGVKIRLIVRSACSLVPGIKGLSENIKVTSIVGRHLEHARIFKFNNAGEPIMYASSADWMPRNLDKRVELMFPILDKEIFKKIDDILKLQICDTEKSWLMLPDGTYARVRELTDEYKLNAQEILMKTHNLRSDDFDINDIEETIL